MAQDNEKLVEASQPPRELLRERFAELENNYAIFCTSLEHVKNLLAVAETIHGHRGHVDLNSPEYQEILRRQRAGESIDEIIASLREKADELQVTATSKELALRQAEVAMLRQEVPTPLSPGPLLRAVEMREQRHAVNLNDPYAQHVAQMEQAGIPLQDIRAQAQAELSAITRTEMVVQTAEALQQGQDPNTLNQEISAMITRRMQNGETLDEIINKAKNSLAGYQEIYAKRSQLTKAEVRVGELRHNIRVDMQSRIQAQAQKDEKGIRGLLRRIGL